MTRRSTAAALLATAAIALTAAPAASADPLSDLFGSAGSSDSGSANLGSSSNKPKHYGKLGRPDAANGVKSINTWVHAPRARAITPGTYPKNSRLGVRWNSTIDSGPTIDGNECRMQIRLTGPKVPKKAQLTRTRDCTATKTFLLRAPGSYRISVTDGISGASNAISFKVQ